MPRSGEEPEAKPRAMTLREVADELRIKSEGSIRNKIYNGQLVGVNVTSEGRSQLRVTRDSFERYWERLVEEAEQRFSTGGAA
jgi:hypothetical protein